jgi:CubicO group peptidase (beta-lactamase class C family)
MVSRRSVLLGLGGSVLAASCSPAAAEPLTSTVLDDIRRTAGMPALVAAAVKRGRAASKWFVGERLLGSGVAVTAQDAWHLGSITKSMTSTLVARLVERGAVRWDDTVGELLKDAVPDMQDAYKSATFRHLLSHRAGLPKDIPMDVFAKYSRDATNVREERRSYAREALRMSSVGPRFVYSNNGYIVAGAMLEAKLDATWEDLIRTHVFEPLKLTSAGFGPPGEKAALTQPVGHFFHDKRLVPIRPGERYSDNPYALGPAGRVHMGLDDVLTYLAAHRDATDVLKPDTWRTLHTAPFGGQYAMGWVLRSESAFAHDGSNTMWYAHVLFDTETGVAAVAATNDGRQRVWETVRGTLLRAAATVDR